MSCLLNIAKRMFASTVPAIISKSYPVQELQTRVFQAIEQSRYNKLDKP
jgi:hypothetical protein